MNNKNIKREPAAQINERIKAEKLQVIAHNGENIGIVSLNDALKMAQDVCLDLVLLSESGKDGVPVAKIMDFGKILYEKKKKKTESKKHQKIIQVKEIKIRPKIGEHDYQTKINRAIEFLLSGKRVKVTLWFRGREAATKHERGTVLFKKINESFEAKGLSLSDNLIHDQDSKSGLLWSRVYYLKSDK